MLAVTYLLSDLGGGTGHHLFGLLRQRAATRWSARILSEARNTARFESPVPTETLAPTRFRRYPLAQLERYRTLRRRLEDEPTDVLHAYFFWSIMYGRLLKARGVVPHLVENREDMGFAWGRHEYAWLRATRSLPDRVICVSEAVSEVAVARERLQASKVRVIRNGISPPEEPDPDAGPALRRELGIPPGAPIVGMVANFNRAVKGADYYVDAIPHVVREMPEVRFLLIGLGDNREDLEARAAAAGVSEHLIFTGFRSDVDRVYRALDVSALTSLSEGLSVTVLESMRHGVPVVATDVGGNPEVVVDGETGYLVPPRDPEAFAAAVLRLLRDPARRVRFGRRAQAVLSGSFRLSDVAASYGAVYRELTGGKP